MDAMRGVGLLFVAFFFQQIAQPIFEMCEETDPGLVDVVKIYVGMLVLLAVAVRAIPPARAAYVCVCAEVCADVFAHFYDPASSIRGMRNMQYGHRLLWVRSTKVQPF